MSRAQSAGLDRGHLHLSSVTQSPFSAADRRHSFATGHCGKQRCRPFESRGAGSVRLGVGSVGHVCESVLFIDIIELWAYIAIVAAVSALSLTILDTDLMQERMRPGEAALREEVSPCRRIGRISNKLGYNRRASAGYKTGHQIACNRRKRVAVMAQRKKRAVTGAGGDAQGPCPCLAPPSPPRHPSQWGPHIKVAGGSRWGRQSPTFRNLVTVITAESLTFPIL